jgi:putative membrane protein
MKRRRQLTLWFGLALTWTLAVAFGGQTGLAAQSVAAVSILVMAGHAVVGLGRIEACAFAAICLLVTFTMENVGVLTGFPFGRYVFLVEGDLPHIGMVPPIVGPLYFGMGYASWVIANLLLNGRVAPLSRHGVVTLPILSAFVMTQWDVVMDPAGSTLAKAWIWRDGGGYFGVPLSNFLGWFLVTWLYFQGFALFAYRRRVKGAARSHSRLFWAVPVLSYLAAGLCHLPPLLDADARLTDGGGRVWSASDLRETAAVVMLFTMAPTVLLALLRLAAPMRDIPFPTAAEG